MLNNNNLFWIGIFLYLISFVVMYPNFFSIADEGSYLMTAYHLSGGKIIIDNLYQSYDQAYSNLRQAYVPGFPLGNSAILVPFASIGWQFIFLAGLLFHLLNLYILIKIFNEYNIPKIYSLFYLFYPGLLFYSRTIMSEIPTITFTLLGFYMLLKKDKIKYFWSGFFLGISCLIRTTNALIVVSVGILLILKWIKSSFSSEKFKKIFQYFSGVFPSFILIIFFNYLSYGSFFTARQSLNSNISETFLYFSLSQLLIYWKPILVMSLIYPLMLYVPFFIKYKRKNEIVLSILLFILVLGKSDIIRYSWLVNFIIGHRYFFPIIPLMLIPYSLFLNKYFKRIVPFMLILLIISAPFIMYKQSEYTNSKFEIMKIIYEVIPDKSLIIIFGDSQYLNNYFGENYSVVSYKMFNELNINEEYYVVYYHNEELISNLKKEFSINEIKGIEARFLDFITQKNLTKIYSENNLVIYEHES